VDKNRPNILLLMSDQHRYDVNGCYGSQICKTPNIDKLAREGIKFTKAYTTTGLCSPARTSIMTGLWPHHHGIINDVHTENAVRKELDKSIPTLAELLSKEGYRCGYLGKWHVGEDQFAKERGFTDTKYVGFTEFQNSLKGKTFQLHDPVGQIYRDSPEPFSAITSAEGEEIYEIFLASRTIEQLREYAEMGEPFFLVSSFSAPHPPYIATQKYASMYDAESIPKWRNFADHYENKPVPHKRYMYLRRGANLPWYSWQKCIARYFACVSMIDEQFGRVISAVDELGLKDNTLVLFTPDHGDMTGSHRQFNKGAYMYEELYHIPLIAKWPGVISPDTTCSAFVNSHDLMPTILSAADIPLPERICARNILPFMQGENIEGWPDDIYAQFHGDEYAFCSLRMVRSRFWKYVYYPNGMDELYDEYNDPYELNNLAESIGHQDTLREMKDRLVTWMVLVQDPLLRWNYDLTEIIPAPV